MTTQTITLYRITATILRDGQRLDGDQWEILGDDMRTRYTTREAAVARAEEMTEEQGDAWSSGFSFASSDLSDVEYSAIEAADLGPIDGIEDATITATDARPTSTDACEDGMDVDIALGLPGLAEPITGTVTLTPMASGQGWAANAPSLDCWIAEGALLDLVQAQGLWRHGVCRDIEAAAARAIEAR